MVTYNPPTRNKFNVWSYADDRAPPGKISAHSVPAALISTGCIYWAKISLVESAEAIIRNLEKKYVLIFFFRNIFFNTKNEIIIFLNVSTKSTSNFLIVDDLNGTGETLNNSTE